MDKTYHRGYIKKKIIVDQSPYLLPNGNNTYRMVITSYKVLEESYLEELVRLLVGTLGLSTEEQYGREWDTKVVFKQSLPIYK